jgi:hypothetical protein
MPSKILKRKKPTFKNLLCLSKEAPPRKAIGSVKSFIYNYFERGAPATYYLSGIKQCVNGKRRSIADLYNLCLYYYPTLTEKTFFKAIQSLGEEEYLRINHCAIVHKLVIRKISANSRYKGFPLAERYSKVMHNDSIQDKYTLDYMIKVVNE